MPSYCVLQLILESESFYSPSAEKYKEFILMRVVSRHKQINHTTKHLKFKIQGQISMNKYFTGDVQ